MRSDTEDDFTKQITDDLRWRIKEISDLKTAIEESNEHLRRVLFRVLITICYAHWEGYVKFSARKYLEHVAHRRLQYRELDRQFFRNYFLLRLNKLSTSKASIKERGTLIDEILDSSDCRFSQSDEELINTMGNLKFKVFEDICLVCGVCAQDFSDKKEFIDKILLERRNAIVHGENTFFTSKKEEHDKIRNETIALMRAFGDALGDHVIKQAYKKAA